MVRARTSAARRSRPSARTARPASGRGGSGSGSAARYRDLETSRRVVPGRRETSRPLRRRGSGGRLARVMTPGSRAAWRDGRLSSPPRITARGASEVASGSPRCTFPVVDRDQRPGSSKATAMCRAASRYGGASAPVTGRGRRAARSSVGPGCRASAPLPGSSSRAPGRENPSGLPRPRARPGRARRRGSRRAFDPHLGELPVRGRGRCPRRTPAARCRARRRPGRSITKNRRADQ